MNMIQEVKKIEQEARELEEMYDQKIVEMEENTDSKIAEMKNDIEEAIEVHKNEQEAEKQQKLEHLNESLQAEEKAEKNFLLHLYEQKYTELVDIVVEEVKKQYGNS